jgi:chromosome partitioning protein
MHDASSRGATNYLNLAREVLQKNNATQMNNEDKIIQFDDESSVNEEENINIKNG